MSATMALTGVRIRLALRNRAFIFFSVVMPIGFLFGFFSFSPRRPGRDHLPSGARPGAFGDGQLLGPEHSAGLVSRAGRLAPFPADADRPGPLLASSIFSNYMLTLPTFWSRSSPRGGYLA